MGKAETRVRPSGLKTLTRFVTIDHLILLIITIIHGINNYIWLGRNRIPPTWDSAQYLTYSYSYHRLFTNPTINFVSDFFEINLQRPPLELIITSPFYSIFGLSLKVAAMTNMIFFTILLFSVYGIGKYMFNRHVGLLAAIITSFFPIMHGLSRNFLADFALASMVALSIFLLLKSEYFTNKIYSMLFGVSMGLGVMTKDAFPFFLIGPLIYVMYRSKIFKILWLFRNLIRNLAAVIIVFIAGCAFGQFIFFIISEIYWPGDPRLTTNISILLTVFGAVLFLVVWFIWTLVIKAYNSVPLNTMMLRNSIPFFSFYLLFIIFIKPGTIIDQYPGNVYIIGSVVILLFVGLVILLTRQYYLTWWKERKKDVYKKHPWLNFSRAVLLGAIVAGWWYVPASHRVFPNLFLNPTYVKPEEGHVNLASWESISYYFLSLLNQQVYWYFFLIIVCVIIVFIHYYRPAVRFLRNTNARNWLQYLIKADWKAKLTLVLWVVIPYILFSSSHTKNSRYIVPYLPAIAIFLAAVLLSFKTRREKIMATIIVLAIGLFQMFSFSFGISGLPEKVTLDTPVGVLLLFGQEPLGRHQYDIHPDENDWKLDEVLEFINDDHSARVLTNASLKTKTFQVGTITDGRVSAYAWKYVVLERDLPINIQSAAFYETGAWENASKHSFYANFPELEYMIELENFTLRPQHQEPSDFFHEPDNFSQFERIKSFDLPEGQTIMVYRRL